MPIGIYQHKKGYTRPPISDKWRKNLSEAHMGQIAWNKGLKGYKEGEKHWHWMGDKVGYRGIHHWIVKTLGKANYCSFNPNHKAKRYDWANISKSYMRDINDWVQLCRSCHIQYDYILSGKKESLRIVLRA